jgi:hypothetical protein
MEGSGVMNDRKREHNWPVVMRDKILNRAIIRWLDWPATDLLIFGIGEACWNWMGVENKG